jgi:hypothetical protein
MMYVPQSSRLTSSEEQVYLSLVNNDPVLFHFLETGEIQSDDRFVQNDRYKSPGFLHFISQKYEAVFTAAIIQCFNTGNAGMMNALVNNPIFLDDEYQEKSYFTILNFLLAKQQKLLTIRNNLQLKKKIHSTDIEQQTTITLLNYLPDEFQGFRSEYCNELVKISKLLVLTDPPLAIELIISTSKLNCLPQSRQRVLECYQQLQTMEIKPTPAENRFAILRLIFAFSKR